MSGDDPDKALFAEAMRQVRRAAPTDKIGPSKPKAKPTPLPGKRQQVGSTRPLPSGGLLQATDQPGVFKADGVSNERLKRLAAGRPPVERTFDLHGVTRDEALALLENGFQEAIGSQARVICIIHGRGLHSQGKPVLKEAVCHWLCQGPFAGAVLAAVPQLGSGGGACLVLLRRQP